MSRVVTALTIASVCVVMTGCSGDSEGSAKSKTTTTTTTFIPRPVVEREIDALLLSPEQINPVMGADKMAITKKHDMMSDDSATMKPAECLAIDGSAQEKIYADSGFTAVRDQALNDGDNFTHYAEQAVVLFPTAKQAANFFAASAKQWPACREYTHVQSGSQWKAGPVSNEKGVLSVVATQQDAKAPGWACGRALEIKNNIIVDVNTCSPDPKNSAVDLANLIAAKVPNK